MLNNCYLALIGLLIGRLLNIIIYRLPITLKQQWLGRSYSVEKSNLPFLNKNFSNCKGMITFLENVPLIGYFFLVHRYRKCHHNINWRYPSVEIITAMVVIFIIQSFGYSVQSVATLIFSFSVIVLTFIDLEALLLPDVITQPVLWLGLIFNLYNLFTDINSALIGAISGYLSLWLVANLFKIVTGKIGMANGDFKLLAMLGAWLGWQPLLYIVLSASLLGVLVIFGLILLKKHSVKKPSPFGPYLALMGWIGLIGHNSFKVILY